MKTLFSFPKICLLAILTTFFSLPLEAQTSSGVNSDGRDFYIGFVYPSFNKVSVPGTRNARSFFASSALVSAYYDCTVQVSYFDSKTGAEILSKAYPVLAHNTVQVLLDSLHMRMNDSGDVAEYRACRITSDKPVNVQYFSTGACSGGSYLALATPALGKNYIIATDHDNPGYG